MAPPQTISQVAARTGFTTSALRFYESAGLITPARTGAGYRVYDDRSVERLRFIARAKQLGLRLEEITELVALWDGDRCAPVAGRLRDLVAEKLTETQQRIAELVAFAGDLQRFQAGLATHAGDGPCDDACACQTAGTAGGEVAASVALLPRGTSAGSPAIACTLSSGDALARVDDWQRVLASASGRDAVEGGVTVHFPPSPELAAEVAALAAAEQSCCSFFTFTVRIDRAATLLTVTAPPEASALVDALFGATA